MRRHFVPGGLGIGVLAVLLFVCSPQCGGAQMSNTSLVCSGSSTAHRAYVVVEHGSGTSITRCVAFSAEVLAGEDAMRQSGIQYQAQATSSGKAMCQIDREPATFDRCFPLNQPYWALFVESGGRWSSAPSGYTDVRLHNGEAMGWHYVPSTDVAPAPPPLPPSS